MKNMGPQGDRGWVVEVRRSGGWQVLLADGTRGQAERIAAEAQVARVPFGSQRGEQVPRNDRTG